MTSKPIPLYWDSCVYIDCIQEHEPHYRDIAPILSDAVGGKIALIASSLVLAEVVKLKHSTETLDRQAEMIQDFFENDYINLRALDRPTANLAADIVRQNTLSPRDAIHVATALRAGCKSLLTYDGEQRGPKPKRTSKPYLLDLDEKIGRPSLTIQMPSEYNKKSGLLF